MKFINKATILEFSTYNSYNQFNKGPNADFRIFRLNNYSYIFDSGKRFLELSKRASSAFNEDEEECIMVFGMYPFNSDLFNSANFFKFRKNLVL